MIVAKFSTAVGGCWIEALPSDDDNHSPNARVFRFDGHDRAEWCSLSDLQASGDRARWYGMVLTSRDFVLC